MSRKAPNPPPPEGKKPPPPPPPPLRTFYHGWFGSYETADSKAATRAWREEMEKRSEKHG